MERANRISVQVAEGGLQARFWRTHKLVKEVGMVEAVAQGFMTDADLNATAQRELYRAWMSKNADKFEIAYDPEDRRQDGNKFPSKYTSDADLLSWASRIVGDDVAEWTAKMAKEYNTADLSVASIEAEEIVPTAQYHLKPVNSKYNSGNWAYAQVSVVASIQAGKNFGYVTMMVALVSGQLKKPTMIGEGGYTYTAFRDELLKDIKQFLPAKEESKKDKKDTADTKKESKNTKNTDKKDKKGSKKDGKSKKAPKKSKKVTEEQALEQVEKIVSEE